jgi:hypothetical protein
MAYLSPTQGHATAEDFTRWSKQAAKMSVAQLQYATQDCRKAEQAMRGWNPVREGYYSDQASTFGDELRRRR